MTEAAAALEDVPSDLLSLICEESLEPRMCTTSKRFHELCEPSRLARMVAKASNGGWFGRLVRRGLLKEGLVALSKLKQDHPGDGGILALADALRTNETIEYLYLNGLGNDGCRALGEALRVNKTIQKLKLTSVCGSLWIQESEGFTHLVDAFKTNSTVRHLHLQTVLSEGFTVLVGALKHNTTLVTLVLDFVAFSDARALKDLLQHGSIRSLFLNEVYVDYHATLAVAWAEGLKANSSLTHLSIACSSGFGSMGCFALARALQTNTSLVSLSLDRVHAGKEERDALVKAFEASKTLEKLRITEPGSKYIVLTQPKA